MRTSAPTAVQVLADALRERELAGARIAIVCGSGLGSLGDAVEGARRVAFTDLEGLPSSGVAGHPGAFVRGRLAGVEVLVQQGRAHLYEGHSPQAVTRSVRAFAELGVRALLLTNAAGSLRRDWGPGTLMRLSDHLNLQRATPLRADEGGFGCPYDPAWGALLDAAASAAGIELERGVYAAVRGPSYETPAEIALYARLGAAAVGMSTAQEALAAHAAGLRVAALSMIANLAAGLAEAPLTHAEVLATGARTAPRLARLIELALPRLAEGLDD